MRSLWAKLGFIIYFSHRSGGVASAAILNGGGMDGLEQNRQGALGTREVLSAGLGSPAPRQARMPDATWPRSSLPPGKSKADGLPSAGFPCPSVLRKVRSAGNPAAKK